MKNSFTIRFSMKLFYHIFPYIFYTNLDILYEKQYFFKIPSNISFLNFLINLLNFKMFLDSHHANETNSKVVQN